MRDPTMLFRSSPARSNRSGDEMLSNSSLIQEISSLRMRLRDLEDDTKSSVVAGGFDDQEGQLSNMLRKDIATLEQEKATLEKDFLNQLALLATENQKRLVELQNKLTESENLNFELNQQLANAINKPAENSDEEKERLLRMLEEQRDNHNRELEQMKQNLASTDIEIAECRGEIDQLHEQLEELQTHRETLIDEVTAAKIEQTEEQRKLAAVKTELSKTKLSVEKLHKELKTKDDKIEQKVTELDKQKKVIEELKVFKKDFEDSNLKIKRLENDIVEKVRIIDQQKDEINEMNVKIIGLQDHKEMLVAEVTDLRMELTKREEAKNHSTNSLQINTAISDDSEGNNNDRPITPLEKLKLEEDLNRLADRLAGFQKRLSEKDHQIESLSNSLTEQRRVNKKLKSELKSTAGVDNVSLSGQKDYHAELSFLRNQNKMLNDEIRSLRNTSSNSLSGTTSLPQTPGSESRAMKSVPTSVQRKYDTAASDCDDSSYSSQRQGSLSAVGRNQSTTRKNLASSEGNNTPRTPVSGLVASFEKRIQQKWQPSVTTNDPEDDDCPIPSLLSALDYADFKQELEAEKSLTRELEQQLQKEKDLVQQLNDQLSKEKDLLQSSSAELETKLQNCQREIRKLKTKVLKLEELKQQNAEELDKLRAEIVYIDVEREDLENKAKVDEQEIRRLKVEVEKLNSSVFQEEKKDSEASEELKFLEGLLREKEESLRYLKDKLKKEEEMNDENNLRLRSQLTKKEQEHKEVLDELLKDVARKDIEIENLKNDISASTEQEDNRLCSLKDEILNLKSRLQDTMNLIELKDIELNRLNKELEDAMEKSIKYTELESDYNKSIEELNELRLKNDQIENTHKLCIKELEDKIMSLELNVADETAQKANLKTALEAAEQRFEKEVSSSTKELDEEREILTIELAKAQMGHADLEMAHSKRIKEIEGTVRMLESRLKSELEEKETLQNALSELSKKAETEVAPCMQKVHDSEINRITVELTKTQIKQADLEREYTTRIRDLEMEIEDLEVEAEEELRQKDKEIENLRRVLEMKEEEINRLENERSRLCTSMNDMSFSRKDEMHELQAEIIDLSTKTMSQEREIQTLRMRLQDYENRTDDTTLNYRQKVKDLENEINDLRMKIRSQIDPEVISELRSENTKLRESVRELKLERHSLSERLDALISERNGSKSTQVLQKRNIALKEEVEKLTKRLKKLEASITRFAI